MGGGSDRMAMEVSRAASGEGFETAVEFGFSSKNGANLLFDPRSLNVYGKKVTPVGKCTFCITSIMCGDNSHNV